MPRTLFHLLLLAVFSLPVMASVKEPPKDFSEETQKCVACHKKNNPGIVQQWGASKHFRAKVGCYECHAADPGDSDAFIHDDKQVKKHICENEDGGGVHLSRGEPGIPDKGEMAAIGESHSVY